ncbi:LysE family translocator [Amycolatopsis sp. YIM 10]|uniref:LysE family translocator n=1 Tax=Amycolatopsis sp. YIM 10 TaxID=2653857 RepID=UPI00129073AC|nr:LysE family translocator [Amycolatopsis sp. YIM 10]QFU85889.1 Homoserine/homoserine lactone efflux protein [Amycolatopsis sp. YIM 10]
MTWGNLAAFLLSSFVLALVPGPATALLVRQSVHGKRAAFAVVAGIEAGVLVWAVAAALGISVLLTASEIAYQTLRIIGVCVLLWLGFQALRGSGVAAPEPPTAGSGFRAGLLINLANPKLGVFAISFLPQFVPAGPGHQRDLLLLAALFVVVDTIWYSLIASVLSRFTAWLRRAEIRRRLERLTGVVLIGLGVRLAFDTTR